MLHRTKAIAALLFLVTAGCGPSGVGVYIDNGSKEEMTVTVDGNEAASITPGDFAKLEYEPGEHRFRIACGKRVVFDDTKDLKASEEFLVGRRYFFNPEQRNRYVVYTVKYGSSPLEGLFDKSDSSDRCSQVREAYKKVLADIKLLPAASWFEVPRGALVLTKPPQVVYTRNYTEKRTVMTRVSRKDYAFFQAAEKKSSPSEADLEALEDVLDRVCD
jgi:hypothetical protein